VGQNGGKSSSKFKLHQLFYYFFFISSFY